MPRGDLSASGGPREEHPDHRNWTARPARPVFYGLFARLSDRFNGKRDADGGLPDIRDPRDEGPAATPTEQLLRTRGEVQKGREHLKFLQSRARRNPGDGLDSLKLLVKEAEAARDTKREALNAIDPKPSREAMTERRSGETGTSEAVVVSRRTAEHAARYRLAEKQYQEASDRVAALRATLERVQSAADLEADVLEIRKRLIDRHADRRVMSYLRSLVRAHRNGAEALDELSRRPPNPEGKTR